MANVPDAQPKPRRRPYGGVSHQERTARRRQQYLDAGLELFGTIGYRQTTVRALAKQASTTDRYFYESFANMEALLVAVYDACLDRVQHAVVGALVEAPADADPEALIAATVDAFLAEFEDRRLARVCWIEVLGVSAAVDAVYQGGILRFAEFIAALSRERFPELMPSEHLADLVSVALVGAISQTALHWLLSDYARPRGDVVDACVTVLLGAGQLSRERHARPVAGDVHGSLVRDEN